MAFAELTDRCEPRLAHPAHGCDAWVWSDACVWSDEGAHRHDQGCGMGVWSEEGVPRPAPGCDGSGLRCAETALRCSFGWPCRRTRCVRCAHCAQTTAASQMLRRAALAGQPPCAARRLPRTLERVGALLPSHGGGGRRGRATARPPGDRRSANGARGVFVDHHPRNAARQALAGGGDLWGDEERRLEGGARSALQHLTRSSCLSAAAAGRAASSAARLRVDAVQSARRADRPSGSPRQHPPAVLLSDLHRPTLRPTQTISSIPPADMTTHSNKPP